MEQYFIHLRMVQRWVHISVLNLFTQICNMNNQSQFISTEADAFVSFNDQIMSVVYLCLSLFIVVVVFKFSTPFQNHWTIFYPA